MYSRKSNCSPWPAVINVLKKTRIRKIEFPCMADVRHEAHHATWLCSRYGTASKISLPSSLRYQSYCTNEQGSNRPRTGSSEIEGRDSVWKNACRKRGLIVAGLGVLERAEFRSAVGFVSFIAYEASDSRGAKDFQDVWICA